MVESGDAVAGLDAALMETVRRTGASAGGLYLLEPDRQLLRLAVMCGVPVEFAAPWTRVPVTAPMPAADAAREGRLVWVGSREELARAYPRAALALPYPFSLAAAPVASERREWGVLLLLWPATHPPHMRARERGHIASSCRRLARVLEEAAQAGHPILAGQQPRALPAPDAVRRGGQPAQAASDFAERLPGGCCALDLEGRITFVSDTGVELLGRSAEGLLGTLPWQSLPWLDDPVYEDRYRAAVISRQPFTFTACRPPDLWLEFHLFPDPSGISVRIIPVGTGAAPSAASPAAPPAVPARAGQLYQLMHLASVLTEAVGVRDVVDLVADQILPAFGADGLVLSAADAGRLKITGHRGYPAHVIERLDGLPLDTSFTPAGQALASGIPSFFSSAEEMARIYPEAPQVSGKQAWAFLPLIISGRPVGCCVLSYDQPRDFPAQERAVLTSLAGLIAQALDRARLYDAKHDLAHGLQQALLPHALPAVAGVRVAARYLPATRGMDIGGDFYDLIRLSDTTCAAVIGDVQGHNVAAAALMGQVRTAVHAHAAAGAAPDEVLARTNRLLTDLDPGLFTSCLYAHLDLAGRRATLASAGHPAPLLRHPDGHCRVLAVPPGLLLGIDPSATYAVTDIALPYGSVLALYTDGLVETPGTDFDDSVENLARHLADATDENIESLIDVLLRHARQEPRTDDIALMLLQTHPLV
ncbi:SpoIIE family protein phosphatase [Streptomyces sp. NPDC003038]|uniref:SpoIIE family protein phosphatase n=1 Tax=unclassified Streptomyces TaxID=2593676 RepID=UPI0033B7B3C8